MWVSLRNLTWAKQIGTISGDVSYGVSADGLGNVYISGLTGGALGGPFVGGFDAFVSKFDISGNLLWSRQLATPASDVSYGVSADGLGNIYISGSTGGVLGSATFGGNDAFVSKYDSAGNLSWTRQLGTSAHDYSYSVSADGLGNVYISGYTQSLLGGTYYGGADAFVSKYDDTGNLAWTKQLGTFVGEVSYGVSADGLGNVFISGVTAGSLDGPSAGDNDVFVSKYDSDGNLSWTRQLGTITNDTGFSASADGVGGVFISGVTFGSLSGINSGGADAFISKFDEAGNLAWSKLLGTSGTEYSYGVSADGLGNVFISGQTNGPLSGPNLGLNDAFVSKYDGSGNLLWTNSLGTGFNDLSYSVSADGLGSVYISGVTGGVLGGLNYGGTSDAFVARYSDPVAVPEPSILLFGGISILFFFIRLS